MMELMKSSIKAIIGNIVSAEEFLDEEELADEEETED